MNHNIELFLQNNDNLLPRDQVKINAVTATPYPDGKRVHVAIDITPFRERPNLDITIRDADNRRVANVAAIGIMTFKVDFNLHLRGTNQGHGDYTVNVHLYYEDVQQPQHSHEIDLKILPDST